MMYTVDCTEVQMLLGYKAVFDDEGPNLQEQLGKLNMHKAISIICELIQVRGAHCDSVPFLNRTIQFPFETILKVKFCGIKPEKPEDIKANSLLNKNKHIISLQMLLILLKKLLIYGDYESLNDTEYTITDDDYQEIIKLQLVVVDEITAEEAKEFNTEHFLYSTYHLNYQRNVANIFGRMYYILEYLSRDRDRFDEDVRKEYRDYYHDFEEKYGFSPTVYSMLLFGELNFYFSEKNKLEYRSVWRDGRSIYNTICKSEEILKVISILQSEPSAYREWATHSEFAQWDFTKFMEYPFFVDKDGHYLSISEVGLSNAFFEKLYWLIRDCYPQDDSRAMAFFGRLFEKYIQDATEDACKGFCQYIPEFQYGKKD